jgi:DNA-binding CsgD family transcriptional regulator
MTTAVKLLPIIAGRKDGYWHGSGRYERGDRRDQRLSHSTYGQRVDQARIRRVLAMLAASWHQIDPDGRRGKRFRTSAKILTEIARSLNKVDGISYLTKASIAARLGMHRNTIYKHCKAMERAGVIIQGHYAMPKGSDFKSYSVFGVPGITGRLPMVLRFRRRHARHVKLVQITWPMATIARYGQRALPQL